IGRRYADVCPSSAELLLQEAMRTRKPASADALAFEPANDLRACSNQGHGKTFWDFKVVPVLDDFDEVDVLMLCISDVTQHKRTEHRLQQAMTKLRRLSQQLVNFQERERHRVARELHDDIGQSLI